MGNSNEIGKEFEQQVEQLLRNLCALHPNLIKVETHPPIELQSEETKYPDFHLTIEYPHECRHYLIECQKRTQSDKDIAQKIYYIRAKSKWKTFFFVYPKQLSPELSRALSNEGAKVMPFSELELWTRRLGSYLKEEFAIEPEKPKVEVFELTPLAYKASLGRMLFTGLKTVLKPILYGGFLVGIITILRPVLYHSPIGRNIVVSTSKAANWIGHSINNIVRGDQGGILVGVSQGPTDAIHPDRASVPGFITIIKKLSAIEVQYVSTDTNGILTVVVPTVEDFQWLTTDLAPPPEGIKRDWSISEESDIKCIAVMQSSIRELTNAAWSLDVSNKPDKEFKTSFSGTENTSNGNLKTFLPKTIKRISEAESNHILGIIQAGDQWLLFCELRGPPEQEPVYMLYMNSGCYIVQPP